jgi:hypothetical protein
MRGGDAALGSSGAVRVDSDSGGESGRFADDLRSTLTKFDVVTVTLGSRGMILAGLSFKVALLDDDDDAEEVGAVFSMVSDDEVVDWRSRPTFPPPILPKP